MILIVDNSSIDKAPPYSLESERFLLAACMSGFARRIAEEIEVNDFYLHKHQIIFGIINKFVLSGLDPDYSIVAEELKKVKMLELVGGNYYLTKLAVPSGTMWKYHADNVKNLWRLRELNKLGMRCSENALDFGSDSKEIIAEIFGDFKNLVKKENKGDQSFAEQTARTMLELDEFMRDGREYPGTGFKAVDSVFNGFLPGSFNILAAATSMGKSTFAMNLALNLASVGVKVGFFTLEDTSRTFIIRAMANITKISLSNFFKKDGLSQQEREKIADERKELAKLPIYLNEELATLDDICIKSSILKDEDDIGIIIVDYLGLIQTRGKFESRNVQVSQISSRLKGLAKELNIPVLALSQLSRGLSKRSDQRPMLSDLRDSGSLEQDADTVIFLYRDEYYNQAPIEDSPFSFTRAEAETAEIIIAKQRNGAVGQVDIFFDKRYGRFFE